MRARRRELTEVECNDQSQAGRIDTRPTPWFWAVNGAAGVLGSGSAVLFSIHTSLDETLKVAAVCYGLLALVALMLGSLVPKLEVSSGRSPELFGNAERIRRERAAASGPPRPHHGTEPATSGPPG